MVRNIESGNTENSGQDRRSLIGVRLTAIRYAARDINRYEFEPLDGELPSFTPGSHIDLHLAPGIVRQYSLVGCCTDTSRYSICVKLDKAGRGGSRHIHRELYVGDQLAISRPRNNFSLIEDAPLTVLLAGGIGITPLWTMARRLNRLNRPWILHYACRSTADMAFAKDLRILGPVQFHADDERGVPLDVPGIVAGTPQDAHLYCCGPAPMLAAFEAATQGRNRDRVHVEYFAPKQVISDDGDFTVVLAKSGRELIVPSGKSILEVLLEAGVDAAFSCEQGLCGACETVVVSGIPKHNDSVLDDATRASNTRMMICCSRSKTDRIVLDL